MTTREKIYYPLLIALGFLLTLSVASQLAWSQLDLLWLAMVALSAFGGLFSSVKIGSQQHHTTYTLEEVPLLALVLTHGWEVALVTAVAVKFSYELYRVARALYLFPEKLSLQGVGFYFSDISNVALSVMMSGWVYGVISQPSLGLLSWFNLGAVGMMGVTWFACSFALNGLLLTVRRNQSVMDVVGIVASNLEYLQLQAVMLLPLSVVVAALYAIDPMACLLVVVPVALMRLAVLGRIEIIERSQKTVQTLVDYIERKDAYTYGHSRRVAEYSLEMAKEMGMSYRECKTIYRAGLIHDLGKIDIPDAVLKKPGALTDGEYKVMKTHTDRALLMGERLQALKEELPFHLAAFHHEHYNGRGYYKLKGREIPLVSRVLAVADTFDALTSDRPYRKGMKVERALAILMEEKGEQLDPFATDAFLRAYWNGRIEPIRRAWFEEKREAVAQLVAV